MSKHKPMRRTATNPLRTIANIRAWMRDHAEPEPEWNRAGKLRKPTWTRKSLDEAVLWWFACWKASDWCDLRTKDIAGILLKGLPPLSLSSLQEDLDSAHDSEDESEPAAQQIEAHLRQHVGLSTHDEDEE